MEFTGTDPDTFSFDMILSYYLGVDPSPEIDKLVTYEQEGQTVPLVIGSRTYGRFRWVVEKHSVKMETFGGDGRLLGATVSVNLLEYLRS